MSTTFNVLDLIFFALMAIFVITAFFRGLVKEVFALVIWLSAFLLSYFLAPLIAHFIEPYFVNKIAVDISVRIALFILVFAIGTFSTSELCDSLKDKIPHMLDRSLGAVYGLGKTLLIFGFIYSLYFNLYSFLLGDKLKNNVNKAPIWLQEAKCYSVIKFSGDLINPAVKKFVGAFTKNFERTIPNQKALEEKINEIIKQKQNSNDSNNSVEDGDQIQENQGLEGNKQLQRNLNNNPDVNSGYNKKDIEKMNRLIDIIDK